MDPLMNKPDSRFVLSLSVDWSRVLGILGITLEVVAVVWVLTSFSFEPVIPVYQWY